MKHWKILSIIIFIFYWNIKIKAQEYDFKFYGVDVGLSQSEAKSIFQDSKGFLWFGTQNGLNMFDGYNFTTLPCNPLDTNSMADGWVYGITEDFEGNIWAATRIGVHKIDRKTNFATQFVNVSGNNNTIYDNVIYDIICSKTGLIYANTPPVLNVIDPKTGVVERYMKEMRYNHSVEDQSIPLFEDSNGLIWMGTVDGLFCFNPTDKKFQYYSSDNQNLRWICNNYITAINQDKNSTIWVATQGGLCRFDARNNTFIQINDATIKDVFVRSIAFDKKQNMWLGTEQNGLYKIAFDTNFHIQNSLNFLKIENQLNCLTDNNVLALYVDSSEILWIGTLQGINKLDLKEKKFKVYRQSNSTTSVNLTGNVIASLFKNDDGKLWIGTWGNGLNIFDRKTGEVQHYTQNSLPPFNISDDFVHVITKDKKRNIWLGTRNGIDILPENSQAFVPIQEFFNSTQIPSFKQSRIYDIYENNDGKFWIATNNGLYIINTKAFSYTHYVKGNNSQSISDNLIYDIFEDSRGYFWIATIDGLDVFYPHLNKFIHINRKSENPNTLCDDFVVSLCEDDKGNIWIGTKSAVNKFDVKDSVFHYYSTESGLPNTVIYQIQKAENGQLWFGTGAGLGYFDKNTDKFKMFTIEDGLQSLEFNTASFIANNGEMFFGGMQGVNSFFPDSMVKNTEIPKLAFTTFSMNTKDGKIEYPISHRQKIKLLYSDYDFTINFAALEYTKSTGNKFAYKLSPLNDEWVFIDTRNFLSFSNLSPGTYTLQIKGSNNDEVWNENGISIEIIISPPWWRSTLAYIIYGISLILAIYLYIKNRERNLVYDRKILENKVAERTIEIEAQKTKIENAYKNVQLLSHIGQKITTELSIERIINTVHENINTLMVADVFAIGWYRADQQIIEMPGAIEKGVELPLIRLNINEKCFANDCFNKNITIILNSGEEINSLQSTVIVGEQPQALIYLPLLDNEKPVGVLTVQSFQPNVYTDYHVHILKNIALYIVIALNNAQIMRKIELQKNDIIEKNTQLQRQTEEITTQRDELEIQRDIATRQRDQIIQQNKAITDSIHYASRIQAALLPLPNVYKNLIPEHFILYQPKDIVSGDFYWMRQVGNKLMIAVADCTGHGVPGAFMSMLGVAFLNEIADRMKVIAPAMVLNELRTLLKTALRQTGEVMEQKDGMDIALCTIDLKTNILQFAGAYNSIFMIRKNPKVEENQIIHIKGDKMPIGVFIKEKDSFTNHEIKIYHGDVFYLYTDGYGDQFEQTSGSKYTARRFRRLLFDIHKLPISEQKQKLEQELNNWQGNSFRVDDILVLGVKYNEGVYI